MTDEQNEQNDKGNGGAKESIIVMKFPALGTADPTIQMQDVTPGQIASAAMMLFGMALHNVFTAINVQQAQAMRQQQELEAIMKGGKLK